jgi:hypothetical protein
MEKLLHKTGKAVVPTKFDLDFALKLGDREWNGLKEIFDLLYAYQDTKLTPEQIIQLNTFSGSELEKMLVKIQQLQQWVNDLQSGMYVNCVYCGYRYGPADEMPVSMGDVLKEHIEHCPEHPMSKLKEEHDALDKALYLAIAEHSTDEQMIARLKRHYLELGRGKDMEGGI